MARIVIVEDDEILAEIASDALMAAGHMANAIHDGAQAIKEIDDSQPELVILDYELPGETGMELLRHIRATALGRGMLVMMMTASSSRLLRARAEHTGADDYVMKPILPDQLVRRVEALLATKYALTASAGSALD